MLSSRNGPSGAKHVERRRGSGMYTWSERAKQRWHAAINALVIAPSTTGPNASLLYSYLRRMRLLLLGKSARLSHQFGIRGIYWNLQTVSGFDLRRFRTRTAVLALS